MRAILTSLLLCACAMHAADTTTIGGMMTSDGSTITLLSPMDADTLSIDTLTVTWQAESLEGTTNLVVDLDLGSYWYANVAANTHITLSNLAAGRSGMLIIHGGGSQRSLSAVSTYKKPVTLTVPYLFTNDIRVSFSIGQSDNATNVYWNVDRFE